MRIIFLTALMIIFAPDAATSASGSEQSVDIQADEMVVKPEENKALFLGNVRAAQGAMVLSAREMEVFYQGQDGQGRSGPGKAGEVLGGQALRSIVAKGEVTLKTPGKEAKAEEGSYDVVKEKIVLRGHVVLTDGANRVLGQEFHYDVASGEGRMIAPKSGAKERARAILTPKKQ